jgi:hypothetical protein
MPRLVLLQSTSRMDGKRKQFLVLSCLLLAVGTSIVYSPVRNAEFLNYDDTTYVVQNAHVTAGLTWKTFTWALTAIEASNWHPLTWLSHALDFQLYGTKPAGHHITNLLLHVVNVLLLFLLLPRVTGAMGRSLLVAALFALHPFNVESVAWVSERKNVLSTLFFLLALGAYGWYVRKPNVKRDLALTALFGLGLTAKPMVITLPFVLLLLDYWPLKRIEGWNQPATKEPKSRRKQVAVPVPASPSQFPLLQLPWPRLAMEKVPLLLLSAGSAVMTVIAQRAGGAIRSLEVFTLSTRLENAVYAYAMYVWKAFWPTRLAVLYPHPGPTLAGWRWELAAAFLVAVSAMVWLQRFTRPYLITGWLWYLGTLVPVIGLVQVGQQAMADRYAYVPLLGIFVMIVWGLADWADSRVIKLQWRMAAAAAVMIGLSLLTRRQISYWHDSEALWTHASALTENNLLAEEVMSKSLLRMDRAQEALPHLQAAARLDYRDPIRHVNFGAALVQLGRIQDAVSEYEIAIEMASDPEVQARSYEMLATLHDELGDYDKVWESYSQALKIAPQQASDMVERLSEDATDDPTGPRFVQLGLLLQEVGRPVAARSAYEQALKLDPTLDAAKQFLDALTPGAKK